MSLARQRTQSSRSWIVLCQIQRLCGTTLTSINSGVVGQARQYQIKHCAALSALVRPCASTSTFDRLPRVDFTRLHGQRCSNASVSCVYPHQSYLRSNCSTAIARAPNSASLSNTLCRVGQTIKKTPFQYVHRASRAAEEEEAKVMGALQILGFCFGVDLRVGGPL